MDEKPLDAINVIPFVDIMLVLLTIVLTTSTLVVSGRLPLKLPASSTNAGDLQAARVIEVAVDGAIYFEGARLAPAGLAARLESLPRSTPIVVRADARVVLQSFIDVTDVLAGQHFTSVAVQTRAR